MPNLAKLPGLHSAASAAARTAVPAFAMLSDRGLVRHVNQDVCAARPDLGAFVVCDGVGGASAGEVASQLAAEALLDALSQPRRRRVRRTTKAEADAAESPGLPGFPEGHPHSRLHEAVCAANHSIFRLSRRSSGLRGMGTTLVAALCDAAERTLWLAHVGDSRCYRLREATLELLTQDHSLVEEQVRAGTLSRSEAEVSPIRNVITRAVGTAPVVEPEIAAHTIHHGDVYLLASDGLTREVEYAELAYILTRQLAGTRVGAPTLSEQQATLEAACVALVDAANAHGGRDNITVLLIAFI